jgi:hypothetical protein
MFGGGSRHTQSLLADALFIKPKTSLIQTEYCASDEVSPCGGVFKAGDSNSKRDSRCDRNAIFASTCRHAVLENVIDVDGGEKLLYGMTILDQLHEKYPRSTICLYYDIICKLVVHLKKHRPNGIMPQIPNLPVLHAYTHGKNCQLLYSPKAAMGSGNCDGEVIERVWAELEVNVVGTQRATLEARQDTITLLAEYHSLSKRLKFLRNLGTSIKISVDHIVAYLKEERLHLQSYKDTIILNMKHRGEKLANTSETAVTSVELCTGTERSQLWNKMVACTIKYKEQDAMAKTSKGAKNRTRYTTQRDHTYQYLKQLISEFNSLPSEQQQASNELNDQPGRIVDDEVVAASFQGMLKDVVLDTLSGNSNAGNEYFWRQVEDLYHSLLDLGNARNFFKTILSELENIEAELKADISCTIIWPFYEAAIARNKSKLHNDVERCTEIQRMSKELTNSNDLVPYLVEVDIGFRQKLHETNL